MHPLIFVHVTIWRNMFSPENEHAHLKTSGSLRLPHRICIMVTKSAPDAMFGSNDVVHVGNCVWTSRPNEESGEGAIVNGADAFGKDDSR